MVEIKRKINRKGVTSWLWYAVIFFVVAVIAGVFGFGLIAGVSYEIAKWLAIIFVVLFIVSIMAGATRGSSTRHH